MEWLNSILSKIEDEKLRGELNEALNREIPKNTMPRAKFNEVNDELKATKTQLDETSTIVKQLQDNAGNVEEYQNTIKELNEKHNKYINESDDRLTNTKKKAALESLLSDKMTKSAKNLVADKYDLSTLELNGNGEIKNSELLIDTIKSNYEDLFITTKSDSEFKNENNGDAPKLDNDKSIRAIMGLSNE